MSRVTKDQMHLGIARVVALRSTCHRLAVGCVLASARGHVLATGYNGRAAGLPNCNESRLMPEQGPNPNPFREQQGGAPEVTFHRVTFPHRCPNSDAPSGQPNGCESIHAEQNALLQCRDVYAVEACYVTHSPCLTCVKLLLNTSCQRIVFVELYPHADAERIWRDAGRAWVRVAEEDA